MVFIGGVILFLLISFVVIMLDYQLWGIESNLISFADLPSELVSCGRMFLNITNIPILLLALSLAVSNIRLIIKEGFRRCISEVILPKSSLTVLSARTVRLYFTYF